MRITKHRLVRRVMTAAAAIVLVVGMVVGAPGLALAQSEIQGHWNEAALEQWMGYGILKGYDDGRIAPDDYVTRAQMVAFLDRTMKYQDVAENTYPDVVEGSWYEEALLRGVAAGVIVGDTDTGMMRPNDYMTREEAAAVIARAVALDDTNAPDAGFSDQSEISPWAQGVVNAMAAKGYVHGYDGYFRPGDKVTRAELIAMLDNVFANLYQEKGEYTGNVEGSAVINADGVTLKDMTISGDLVIAEGVGDGHVELDNVTVEGKLIVRGGGENSVIIKGDSKIGQIIVDRLAGAVRVAVEDAAEVAGVTVTEAADGVRLEGKVGDLSVQGAASVVEVAGTANSVDVAETATDAKVTLLEGSEVETVTSQAKTATITIQGTVATVSVSGEGNQLTVSGSVSAIDVTGNGAAIKVEASAKVEKVFTSATGTKVEGEGKVEAVVAGEGSSDVTVSTENTMVENDGSGDVTIEGGTVAPGESDTTPGGTTSGGGSTGGGTVTPPPVTYYTVTFKKLDGTVVTTQSVPNGGQAIEPNVTSGEYPQVDDSQKLVWYNGTSPYDFDESVNGDIELTAIVGNKSFSAGNGSESYPYLVANATEFAAINELADNMKQNKPYYFLQIADFTVETSVTSFCGQYDGGGHIICAPSTKDGYGSLFRDAYGNTKFCNMSIESRDNFGLALYSNYQPCYETLTISNIDTMSKDNGIVSVNTNNFGFLIINYIGDDYSSSRNIQQITTIEDCHNSASLINQGSCAGAFIGSGYALTNEENSQHEKLIVKNSSNSGNITAATYAGSVSGNPYYINTYLNPYLNSHPEAKVTDFILLESVSNTGQISASSDVGVFGTSNGPVTEAYPSNNIGGTYTKVAKLSGSYTVYYDGNGSFSVSAVSPNENEKKYQVCLSVATLYYDHDANYFGNSIRFFQPATTVTEETASPILKTTSIHAYDYNTAISKNIVTGDDSLSYQTEGAYQYALKQGSDGNLVMIFKNIEGKVDYVDSPVNVQLYAYNDSGQFIGYKDINQS